jgi:eukaryotic-like serine/threonine-protein kinase
MSDERTPKPDSPSSMEITTTNLNMSNPPSEADMPTLSSMVPPVVSEFSPTITSGGSPPMDSNYARTLDGQQDPTDVSMPSLGGMPFVPGFEVMQEVGRGGMGVVYKAREYALNRLVALKMIIAEHRSTAEELIRFRLEAETAARVRHPNVAQVHESGNHGGRPYLVMEWIDGGTLSDVLKASRMLPYKTAMELMIIIARAVHQIHLNGVIHRDLKPSNIMLARLDRMLHGSQEAPSLSAGSRPSVPANSHATVGTSVVVRINSEAVTVIPKVTDFGLAKLATTDMGLTETGRIMGTPDFMAPEQAAGRIREICPMSDVHSLGVILYQMLVGNTPFRAESTYAVINRILNDEAKSIRQVTKNTTPQDLETVCMKCLRKKPEDRYLTAAGLADDLQAILDGRPISARRVGPVERYWKFAKRNPVLVGLATTSAGLFVIGSAAVTWQWREAVAARNEAIISEGKAVEARDQAVTAKKSTEAVNRFLVDDMLASANPEKALGRVITVQEILDEAALRIDTGLTSEPSVEAGIRDTLGRSYRALGKPLSAIPQLRKSLSYREANLGRDDKETLSTLAKLAVSLDDAGDWAEAEKLFRDVVERSERAHGESDPMTVDMKGQLALALQVHGKSEEGFAIMKKLIHQDENSPEISNRDTWRRMNDFGLILYNRTNLDEAEKYTRQAYDLRKKHLSVVHPESLESGNNLAAIFIAKNTPKSLLDAEKLMQEIIAQSEQVRGMRHIDTLSGWNNYGRLLYRTRRFAEAESTYQRIIQDAIQTPGMGAKHPVTLTFRHNLGTAQFSLRKYAEAIQTIRIAYTLFQEVMSNAHPETLQAGHDLAAVYSISGDPVNAVKIFAEVYPLRHDKLGATRPETITTAVNWGETAANMKVPLKEVELAQKAVSETRQAIETSEPKNVASVIRFIEAESKLFYRIAQEKPETLKTARERLKQAEKLRRGQVPPDPEKLIAVLQHIGNLATNWQDHETAIAYKREILSLTQGEGGNSHRFQLAQLLIAANKLPEAVTELEVLSTNRQLNARQLGQALCLLGRCNMTLERFEEAETKLLAGYELLEANPQLGKVPAVQNAELQEVRNDLVKLYTRLNRPRDVAKWQNPE